MQDAAHPVPDHSDCAHFARQSFYKPLYSLPRQDEFPFRCSNLKRDRILEHWALFRHPPAPRAQRFHDPLYQSDASNARLLPVVSLACPALEQFVPSSPYGSHEHRIPSPTSASLEDTHRTRAFANSVAAEIHPATRSQRLYRLGRMRTHFGFIHWPIAGHDCHCRTFKRHCARRPVAAIRRCRFRPRIRRCHLECQRHLRW